MDLRKKLFQIGNAILAPVLSSRPVTRLAGVQPCTLRFEGRKSHQPVSLPAWCKPIDGGVRVDVAAPAQKRWWRNFRNNAHPLTITIDGVDHAATGLVEPRTDGKVSVRVTFDS